nr:MAG TPA: hypothetical protein [Caudoviricetes sp.]
MSITISIIRQYNIVIFIALYSRNNNLNNYFSIFSIFIAI